MRPLAAAGKKIIIFFLLAACGGTVGGRRGDEQLTGRGPAPLPGATPTAPPSPIRHIFIIVKENHTYDNLFATFPGGDGATIAARGNGSQIALQEPWTDLWYPGSNSWGAAHSDYAAGKMNGFDSGESFPGVIPFISVGPYATYAPASAQPEGPAKYYWQLAQAGVLCDRYFTSVLGPSFPNHLMSVAARAGRSIGNTSLLSGNVPVLDAQGNQVDHAPSSGAGGTPLTPHNDHNIPGLHVRH